MFRTDSYESSVGSMLELAATAVRVGSFMTSDDIFWHFMTFYVLLHDINMTWKWKNWQSMTSDPSDPT